MKELEVEVSQLRRRPSSLEFQTKAVEEKKLRKGLLCALGCLFLYAAVLQINNISQSPPQLIYNSSPSALSLAQRFFLTINPGEEQDSGINASTGGRTSTGTPSSYGEYDSRSLTAEANQLGRTPNEHLFEPDSKDDPNPIKPHNKICRNYLKKFLEGTTDNKDECQGLENAYDAADCSEDITLTSSKNKNMGNRNLEDINNSTQDGDDNTDTDAGDDDTPAIDDFFEEFQCCKVISHYYSSRCLYHQQFASLSLLGIVAVLILCSLVKTLITTLQLNWLPEAGGCILVGAVVGAGLTTQLPQYQMNLGTFNDDLFLFILLPPIIFHASLSIDKGKFKTFLFPIMMFAVVGTILSAVVTGFVVHYLTQVVSLTTTIPLLDSMIFGSLISSVDPVATLSILHSMGISNTNMLYVIVFGESILNDGVSIAMFESLVMHLDGTNQLGQLDNTLILSSAKYFWTVSWISIVVGVSIGITCTIYFWALRGRHGPVSEVATFFCFAMLSYYISDSVGGSGIVSIMCSGLLMDVFVRGEKLTESDTTHEVLPQQPSPSNWQDSSTLSGSDMAQPEPGQPLPSTCCRLPNYTDCCVMFSGVGHISNRAKIHVGFVADVLANLMETAIFAYLGLFLFSNNKWDDVPLIMIGVFSCVISRALMVVVVSLIVNSGTYAQKLIGKMLWNTDVSDPTPIESQVHQTPYIDRNMQIIMLYSGVRGAVSLALVENIPLFDAVTKHGSQFKPALKAMTNSSIIFTVFVFGASTYYTLKRQRETRENGAETQSGHSSNRGALMTSLLQNHSLELNEEQTTHNVLPPWMNQS